MGHTSTMLLKLLTEEGGNRYHIRLDYALNRLSTSGVQCAVLSEREGRRAQSAQDRIALCHTAVRRALLRVLRLTLHAITSQPGHAGYLSNAN